MDTRTRAISTFLEASDYKQQTSYMKAIRESQLEAWRMVEKELKNINYTWGEVEDKDREKWKPLVLALCAFNCNKD